MEEQREIVDFARFGTLLRAARQVAGYERASQMSQALAGMGVPMSEDIIYKVEQGKQPLRIDQYLAILMLLKPMGGHAWFAPAYREDLREWISR